MTYKEWYLKIQWLKDKIILPDGNRIDKKSYMTKDGFDINSFNKLLFKEYNKAFPVKKDGRRYKTNNNLKYFNDEWND